MIEQHLITHPQSERAHSNHALTRPPTPPLALSHAHASYPAASASATITLTNNSKCPPQLQAGWVDFYQLYRKTIESSGVPEAEKVATKVQATIADTVFNQVGCGEEQQCVCCRVCTHKYGNKRER